MNGRRPQGFEDPEPFEWNKEKEQQLWGFISELDDTIDSIDWESISTIMNAPVYFLKKRSYTLIAKHMSLIKQQLEYKKKILEPSSQPNLAGLSLETPTSINTSEDLEKNNNNDDRVTIPQNNLSKSSLKTLLIAKDSFRQSPVISSPLRSEHDNDLTIDHLINTPFQDSHVSSEKIRSVSSTDEALSHLQSSKILNYNRASPKDETNEKNDRKEEADIDISSSLSVSKSALEEALLERLHF